MSKIVAAIVAVICAVTGRTGDCQQVFFGNLHSHTSYSDGQATPRDAYKHARDVAHIDFLAITEHNHAGAPSKLPSQPQLYNGAQTTSLISQAGRFNEDGRFVALYGQEFSSIGSGNHANVLEIRDVISTNDVPNGRWDLLLNSWLSTHLDSEGKPAIMLLNHPDLDSPDEREYGIDDFPNADAWRAKLEEHVSMINMINGPSHDGTSPGRPSENEFLRYLNLGLHVAPTADQDNHRQNWGDAATTRTAVVADSLTKANVLAALRVRHVYATQDRNLRIIARVNGELAGARLMGAAVPAPNSAVPITIFLQDDDEPDANYTIDLFADEIGGTPQADVVMQFSQAANGEPLGNGTHQLDGFRYAGGRQYLFLKIRQTDPDHEHTDIAWLAPVWFEPGGAAPPVGGGAAVTLDVNLELEEARVTNRSNQSVDLSGWRLVSTVGNQEFRFGQGTTLNPGRTLIVTSGSGARNDVANGIVRWTTDFIWRNAGDPGQLIDPNGVVVAQTE